MRMPHVLLEVPRISRFTTARPARPAAVFRLLGQAADLKNTGPLSACRGSPLHTDEFRAVSLTLDCAWPRLCCHPLTSFLLLPEM